MTWASRGREMRSETETRGCATSLVTSVAQVWTARKFRTGISGWGLPKSMQMMSF